MQGNRSQFDGAIAPARRTMAALLFISALSPVSAESTSNFEANFEFHHVILMLDQGPIHARFGIALEGRPVAQQRAEFIEELVARLDTNGDSKLTRDEANQSSVLRRHISKGTQRFLRKRNLGSKQIMSMSDIDIMVKKLAGQPVV